MAEHYFRHIVRIANTDLDGNKSVYQALRKIRGVNYTYSNMACKISNINRTKKLGDLSEAETEVLEQILLNPKKYTVPLWLFNRRKDYETGEDRHVLSNDLKFEKEQDIKRLQRIKSNRGLRHAWNLPLRGQRTKSNFRRNKGKGSLGVKRKQGSKSGRV
ncbi:30S ribosomal protein S13 [Candidatus Woesearchaeota archaeon CG_4_10_14_0_8_um_filter_47_5]|nr:MAG: 30S ribosomal protein S13 [Candidatus Woesearchaeota archaeon CG_4_10_14_0_8_um_filter_47_5]